jgi:hypothetical protein
MTQVWMIRNSDTDIHLFNRYDHLEPSIQVTYSRCEGVTWTTERSPREIKFTVTGKRDGKPFTETIIAHCLPVWTEPSHL